MTKLEGVKYTVVIPERDEGEELEATVKNIRETQLYCDEIIVVHDDAKHGTARSRHRGVAEAKHPVVITVDGHMRFQQNALDMMARHIEGSSSAVCCLVCHHNEECSLDGPGYFGADLYEFGGEYALEPKWAKRKDTGNVDCLMGACYGVHKSWYDLIGQPWRIGRGWGCDETLLSIPTLLCGGTVQVLPFHCAHRAKKAAHVQYRQTPEEINAIWWTRRALVELVKPDNMEELLGRMHYVPPTNADTVEVVRQHLELKRKLSWSEFKQKHLKA